MRFRFQPLRAAQATAILVRLEGGRLNYTKALKLLYLADRRSILETGTSITGDSVVNMANGPVLSNVYDCIKSNASNCLTWVATFSTEGYDLKLVSDPGDSELSDYDVDLLTEVYTTHRAHDYSQMINEVHRLPEWCHPRPAKSRDVEYADILQKGGASPETIQAYEALNASVEYVDSIRIVRA